MTGGTRGKSNMPPVPPPFPMPAYYTASALNGSDPKTCKLGVIGHPIAHSCSPPMQQAALDKAGLPYSYIRLQASLEKGGFEEMLQQLHQREFIGVNVTIPFKKQAYAAASQTDALSSLCEASNTLVRQPNGWHGYNTDGPGFECAIKELSNKPLSQLKVALMGACGGAGSALAAQCALSHCPHLTLINRPKPALDELATKLSSLNGGIPIATCPFGTEEMRQAVHEADLIVNATSLGLKQGDALPLPPEWLHSGQMVYDIVTHDTPLRCAAKERGCLAENGLSMLLWQGAIAFEHWFGQKPDIHAMRCALASAIAN